VNLSNEADRDPLTEKIAGLLATAMPKRAAGGLHIGGDMVVSGDVYLYGADRAGQAHQMQRAIDALFGLSASQLREVEEFVMALRRQ
jgi:hypothetical protein